MNPRILILKGMFSMSVRFDLTAIAPELMDAVIYMDKSPAYEAFKEEIEAILREFNESGHLSSGWKIDEKDLTAKSEATLKNMHRAYLIWSFCEERKRGEENDACCNNYVKLFFKSQFDTIVSLNCGQKSVGCESAGKLIESFKSEINGNPEVYASVKEFFKGYVYGYSFNYLEEAVIMKKYAEMLAYLGVMSNKIPAIAPERITSEQQKILPKMAMLLSNDRFKYLNGFVPLELMLEIVYDRLAFSMLFDNETDLIKERIREYIEKNYRTDKEENVRLISDDVTASFASSYFSSYVNVPVFSTELYRKCFSGVRTFLDCDRDDTGDYNADKLAELVSAKCSSDYNSFYTTEKEPCNDMSLGGNDLCFKYPFIFRDGSDYWFSGVYEELIYPVLDNDIYEKVPENEISLGMFPFADEIFHTNCIRTIAGISDRSTAVRKDRIEVLEQIRRLAQEDNISARDRRMLMLEQILCLASGSCSEAKYKAFITENIFGKNLYEDYIRYRMDLLANKALESLESKKQLLDDINRIS